MQKNNFFVAENEVQYMAGHSYECLTFCQTGLLIRIDFHAGIISTCISGIFQCELFSALSLAKLTSSMTIPVETRSSFQFRWTFRYRLRNQQMKSMHYFLENKATQT